MHLLQDRYAETLLMHQIVSCTSEYKTYFQGALFVIQGSMLAFGAFLAWETRKVNSSQDTVFPIWHYSHLFRLYFICLFLDLLFYAIHYFDQVKLAALNDSKLIGVCIYNVAILSIIGSAISMVITDNPDAGFGFTSAFLLAGTFLTSCVLFVPKVGFYCQDKMTGCI